MINKIKSKIQSARDVGNIMNESIKKGGSYTILIGLLTAAIIGILSWGLLQSTHVPVLEEKFTQEMKRLNASVVTLTEVGLDTNKNLKMHSVYQREQTSLLKEITQDHKYRIKTLETSVSKNTDCIEELKH